MIELGAGLVVWDVDGTLIPADLRWLRRAIAQTYHLPEDAVSFPEKKVHGYTDESIVIDAAVCSGLSHEAAEEGIVRFPEVLAAVMAAGSGEIAQVQPAYPGAAETIEALHEHGFRQTVLTGNLRSAAEAKLRATGLSRHIEFAIGGYGSDARDRFELPAVVAQRFLATYGEVIDPARTVVIGDAPNDIACARHGGFHVAVVTHRLPHDELARHHPDAILDALAPGAVISAIESLVEGRG